MTMMTDETQAHAPGDYWKSCGLRLLVFFLALMAILVVCERAPDLVLRTHPDWPKLTVAAGGSVLTCLVMITAYRLLVRWTEKRSAGEIGATAALPLFLGGLGIGVALFCGVYAVLYFGGSVAFARIHLGEGVGITASASLAAAVGEELVFRGTLYRIFEERFGTLAALLASGAIFGLMHAWNRGASWWSTIAIALEAGVLLGAAYALARSLWLPIGLHFGWNFAEGGIFSAAVSGGSSQGLIDAKLSGATLLTGGVFGPEASIEAVALCLIAAIIILTLAIRRGHWKPLSRGMDKAAL